MEGVVHREIHGCLMGARLRCMRLTPAARTGGSRLPTLAAELLTARDELTVARGVGLALRADRRASGDSQRAYAERRGWSKTHQHRLETNAASLRLGQVMDALQATGYELAIARENEELPVQNGPDAQLVGPGRRVWPTDWPDHELIGRDRAGRRFPADREIRRVSSLPNWWIWRHATDIRAAKPTWTASPLPRDWLEELRPERAAPVSPGGATVEDMDTMAGTPSADRPELPDGYGIPETAEGQLAWSDVEPRLVQAMHYWINSVRPDGTPHSVPRW